jgi:uncharacterized protein DUF6602
MSTANPLSIQRLFEGSLQRLRAEAEYFSRLTTHSSELGRINETHLAKLLRDYLPPKIGIGTGFVACGGDAPDQSPQCDIILYDALNNSPLYNSDAWSIYPIEMVYGIIEVKTTLDKREFEDAFVKCAKVRAMARTDDGKPNKAYLLQGTSYMDKLSPRFFVFAYAGWKTVEALLNAFKELSMKHAGAHIHGVCSLTEADSISVWHNAFKNGNERFSSLDANGFRFFLANLPTLLNLMLPAHRVGMGFDQVDLRHYALAVE